MEMDTPQGESNAPLSVNQAASLFSSVREPEKQQPAAEKPEATAPVETPKETPEATQADAEPEKVADAPAEPAKFTVKVDGKDVELTEAEIADHYKNGLRQADYTRKTMEAAEQRKAAEAESAKAREERQKYAQGLQQAQSLLQAQLQEQSQIDWHKLRETDPNEFLRQWHLYSERQANLQRVVGEQQQLHAKAQAEQADQIRNLLKEQQDQLLAKLPEWKDEAKAKAEKSAIKDYLKGQGLEDAQIDNITDHRVILLSRKAMLYDQMMSKAEAAAKKVTNLPQKVEKPGGGEVNPLDGRTRAMKQLNQTGSVAAAAAVFGALRKTS